MLSVSLFVEFLRTRPSTVVWVAALTQVALWTLVPALFYASPPGNVAIVLAVGHEFRLGSDFGPPLAYWLAEVFFAAGGMFGVYLLSQLCVLVTYGAVFALGRSIVGPSQAALAVLLMAGISALTVPTPDFGPGILAMALWSLVLLHYWRAVGEGRRIYWFVLAFEIGLLLLASYATLVLVGLLIAFTLMTARGRAQLVTIEPWIAGVLPVVVVFPHLIWLDQAGGIAFAGPATIDDNMRAWARLLGTLIVSHAGLGVLVALGHGLSVARRMPAPEIARAPVDPTARRFVFFFALTPVVATGALALFATRTEIFVAAPLVVLSGLAVIVAAPDRIRLTHQRLTALAWAALLVLPPVLLAASVLLLPWTFGIDLRVSQPAGEMGRFFAENFQRRTGKPLAIVAGDQRLASLIALSAPSRPSLYFEATPERTPWVTRTDIEQNGAIVVWSSADTRSSAPPAAIRERFPDLVPEVPRAFERAYQGRRPLFRVGWAVMRPREAAR
jgi:4-amino-4-deoxy-L-arabinose transferase-like glycosyltransferase